jgi:hypothetical protein
MNNQPATTLRQQLPAEGLVRIDVLVGGPTPVLPFSRATVYRMMERGTFPKCRKLGRLTVWSVIDIRAWLSSFDGSI